VVPTLTMEQRHALRPAPIEAEPPPQVTAIARGSSTPTRPVSRGYWRRPPNASLMPPPACCALRSARDRLAAHDARTVRLDCFHADVEKVSALHVRVAFCDQLHDLPLAPSPRPIRTARRSRLAPARVGWHDVRGRHAGRFAWQARETTVRNTGPGGMSGRRGAKLASLDHFTPPLISGRPPFAISASR